MEFKITHNKEEWTITTEQDGNTISTVEVRFFGEVVVELIESTVGAGMTVEEVAGVLADLVIQFPEYTENLMSLLDTDDYWGLYLDELIDNLDNRF